MRKLKAHEENDFRFYFSLKSIFLHIDNWEKMLFSKYGLSVPRFYILMHIYNQPGINYSDLTDLMLCTKSNITRVVGAMKRDGLVKRIVNPEDKRSYHLYLQTKGEGLYKEAYSAYLRQINQLLAKFSDDQLTTYTAISEKIEDVFEPRFQQIATQLVSSVERHLSTHVHKTNQIFKNKEYT